LKIYPQVLQLQEIYQDYVRIELLRRKISKIVLLYKQKPLYNQTSQ